MESHGNPVPLAGVLIVTRSQNKEARNSTFLVLFGHNDTPGVVLSAVFDVDEPVLDAEGDGGALTGFAGGDLDVAAAVVDERNGCDEVLQGC